MNTEFEHRELTRLLNRRAEHARENERIRQMEEEAAPMLYTVLIVVLLLAGAGIWFGWK